GDGTPAGDGALSPDPARMKAPRAHLDEGPGWGIGLSPIVVPPADDGPVRRHAACVDRTRPYLGEGANGGSGLTGVVTPGAANRAVCLYATDEVGARA